ncbi:MAG: GNAT family N-acetyltransferase [Opitutaceae bacterium]|jgi:GNAT superfamily N-acetyltransferase
MLEFRTEPLSPIHSVERFDCGEAALDDYLKRHALQSQAAGASRVYVVLLDARVIGYYSLSAGAVGATAAGSRLIKGLARNQPVPIVLLGRLAVDRTQRGRGLGTLLLRDAVLRFLQAAEMIGARALLIHAKNERLAQFYARYGFEPLPTNPLHVALLFKDARRTAAQ